MLVLSDFARRTDELVSNIQKLVSHNGDTFPISESDSNGIRVAFVGPYSAGKSTLIKMITGIKEIPIGAGITTQESTIYSWNGLEIVDTPGIHTELRPDHDELTYKEIAKADIIVFVITNELFDSHLAEHFRTLAVEKEKASEMLLVVNKMGNTSEGNTKEQQEVLLEDLRRILTPYTPEQLYTCFVDAKFYLQSTSTRVMNPALAEKLEKSSGFDRFIEVLNQFVSEKGVFSKLTTRLYLVDHFLENRIEEMQPKAGDADLAAYEESLLQQRHVLIESRGRISQEVKDVYTLAASHIKDIGLETADLMVDGCNKDEVEKGISNAVESAEIIMDKSQQEALNKLEDRLNELGITLEEIENSEFSKKLKTRLVDRFENLPANVQAALAGAAPQLQKAGQFVVGKAISQGAQGGMKLANFSGSSVHELVLKAGHKAGYKFKPWEAIKFTKGVAVAGEALNVFGIGLGVFMQIKDDKDQERVREYLKLNRQNIRGQFGAAANELEDYSLLFVKENVEDVLAPYIEDIDQKLHMLREMKNNENDYLIQLEAFHQECSNLISEIHETTSI